MSDPTDKPSTGTLDEPPAGSTSANDLFSPPQLCVHLTRRQKRLDRLSHGLVRAKDPRTTSGLDTDWSDTLAQWDLERLQKEDESLQVVRRLADEGTQTPHTFIHEGGLLYRIWRRKGHSEDSSIQQLVLPHKCRQQVLRLAHSISLSGHFGRKKTFNHIALCFYWPTMHKDVADFCRSCDTCQRFRRHKTSCVPLVPLPLVEEPFARVAMDIVGPLPRS
jgi:hypothetical protein